MVTEKLAYDSAAKAAKDFFAIHMGTLPLEELYNGAAAMRQSVLANMLPAAGVNAMDGPEAPQTSPEPVIHKSELVICIGGTAIAALPLSRAAA